MTTQTWFQIAIVGFGAMATSLAALAYLRRVTLERPAIGKFNGRDLVTLFVLIVTLPILYLALPATALTGFLVITFSSALFIALRPVISQNWRRIAVPVLLAANIVVAHTLLGRTGGWQIYWIMTSAIVLVAAVGVSNLYVQGGMSMRHVAWFAIFLAAYDAFFTMVIPLTLRLADSFVARPLDPSIGFRFAGYNANIGIGDLLVYSLFVLTAYKGFGQRAATTALGVVAIFGALLPATAPILISHLARGSIGTVVPAQTCFGPAAFVTYQLLARRGTERTVAQWRAAAIPLADTRAMVRPAPAPAEKVLVPAA
jgi:hypothetical protein